MTTTLGLSFSARSVAKKFVLFALNITILMLGVACSILCLYQVKLMPQRYEDITAKLEEANVTDLASARATTHAPPTLMITQRPKGERLSTVGKYRTTTSTSTVRSTKITTKKSRLQTAKAPKFTLPLSTTTTASTTAKTLTATMSMKDIAEQVLENYLSQLLKNRTAGLLLKPPLLSQLGAQEHTLPVVTTAETTVTALKVTSPTFAKTPATTAEITTGAPSSSTMITEAHTEDLMTTEQATNPPSETEPTKITSTVSTPKSSIRTKTYATTRSTTPLNTTLQGTTSSETESAITNGTKDNTTSTARSTPSKTPPPASASSQTTPIPAETAELTPQANAAAASINFNQALDAMVPPSKRSVSNRRKRSVTSSSTAAVHVIPPYFKEIFELVQTSLYTCTAAGVLIFFSSLLGICGGIFRVNGCLKFSIGALVVVIIGEMATIGFIFYAHDKASNRSKHRYFYDDFKLLCDLGNFCVNEMMLVMVGSFLCVCVVLQIGSITLSCHLMNGLRENDMEYAGNGWRKGALSRADIQMTNGVLPFANPMQMPYFAGQNMPFPYSSMPMYGMGPFIQPMYSAPGQRPVFNIIS